MGRYNDLIGMRFGKLVVTEKTKSKRGKPAWNCKCDCGNFAIFETYDLMRGRKKSCGCLRSKLSKNRMPKVSQIGRDKNVLGYHDGTVASLLTNKPYASNTSGTRGVYLDKRYGVYNAYINFKSRRYSLGSYDNMEEAAKVRKEAEHRIWGDFLEWYNNEYRKEK